MDYMRKFLRFTDALNKSGLVSDIQEGDTAVVCDDCIVVISRTGDTVGYTVIDQIRPFDFRLGFTPEDYETLVNEANDRLSIIQKIRKRGLGLWKSLRKS